MTGETYRPNHNATLESGEETSWRRWFTAEGLAKLDNENQKESSPEELARIKSERANKMGVMGRYMAFANGEPTNKKNNFGKELGEGIAGGVAPIGALFLAPELRALTILGELVNGPTNSDDKQPNKADSKLAA